MLDYNRIIGGKSLKLTQRGNKDSVAQDQVVYSSNSNAKVEEDAKKVP